MKIELNDTLHRNGNNMQFKNCIQKKLVIYYKFCVLVSIKFCVIRSIIFRKNGVSLQIKVLPQNTGGLSPALSCHFNGRKNCKMTIEITVSLNKRHPLQVLGHPAASCPTPLCLRFSLHPKPNLHHSSFLPVYHRTTSQDHHPLHPPQHNGRISLSR